MSRRTLPWSALLGPFAIRAWHDTVFVAAGAAYLALPGFGLVYGYDFVYEKASLDTMVVLCLIAGLPWILQFANRAQRSRFWSLRRVDLRVVPLYQSSSTQPAARVRPSWRGFGTAMRSGAARRQLTYHFVASPCFALAGIGLLIAWPYALAMSLMPAYIALLAPTSELRHALWVPFKPVPASIGFAALGIALLWLIPMVTHAVAVLDTRIAVRLLGPDRERELEQRVAGLTESRSALVQAADAERRRIERDLHDGAQQRLVSLAINLGMARATLDGAPPEAMEVITAAHEEAKAALAEMRDLVRGLHPAVLDDRGLDAALSGIAARAPLPVRLTVDVPERPAPAVEAVAYFVVSEALANIAKHAQAGEARIDVERMRGRLWIRIRDDGVGGADPGRGSGLAGLARRAASVDGSFHLSSPAGGPTVITVELPCEP